MYYRDPYSQFNDPPQEISDEELVPAEADESDKTRKGNDYNCFAKQFRDLGDLEFAAVQFSNYIGQVALYLFQRAVRSLKSEQKREVLIDVEDTLPTILGEHFIPEIIDLLMYGDGVWGEQEDLANALNIPSKYVERGLERSVFCYMVAMHGAVLKYTQGQYQKKLSMFNPLIDYLVKNRRY